jgi:hypothetical protein
MFLKQQRPGNSTHISCTVAGPSPIRIRIFHSFLCRTTHFDRAGAETGVIGQ